MPAKIVNHLATLIATLAILSPSAIAEDKWRSLFNGKDLDGWEVAGKGKWAVEEGAITGRWDPNDPGGGWLVTKDEFGDFVLKLKYWVNKGGNSGVAIRDPSHGKQRPSQHAYEIQIISAPSAKMPSGSIYNIVAAPEGHQKEEEWNEFQITAIGNKISVLLNGVKVAETERADRPQRGAIGLQIHDERTVVRFKDIQIKELAAP